MAEYDTITSEQSRVRLQALRDHPNLNGIAHIEVLDRMLEDTVPPPPVARQQTLFVHCVRAVPLGMTAEQVALSGGVRITGIRVRWAFAGPRLLDPTDAEVAGVMEEDERAFLADLLAALSAPADVLVVRTNAAGDFSPYTLRVSDPPPPLPDPPPARFEPSLSALAFSFKVECPSDFDCKADLPTADLPGPAPRIDYLAKDYASFRRQMLDRLAVTMPGWTERNPADVGVMLVETLAYVADHLSYYQDAVATEAYLGTARRRISVRRHARLLDYRMHEGCNARAWVHVTVEPATLTLPVGTQLLTRVVGQGNRISPGSIDYDRALAQQPVVFETMAAATLHTDHNLLDFYAWGEPAATLSRGATRATLAGHHPALAGGAVLVLKALRGQTSGRAAEADPARCQAVRLLSAEPSWDQLGGRFLSPPTNDPVAVTEITWHAEDALDFPLCLAHVVVPEGETGAGALMPVSGAVGNLVPADAGRTFQREALVPPGPPDQGRYRPHLPRTGITFCVPYDADNAAAQPARALHGQDVRRALPAVRLCDPAAPQDESRCWEARRDLLDSDRFTRAFVIEVEEDGTTLVRFGDGQQGRRPSEPLVATYRVGSGRGGNVGAGAIAHVVALDPGILAVKNPLPAQGGEAPEPIEAVKQYAPQAFRTQERAVTAEDYAQKAGLHPDVQQAVATLRWTGSWHTVFLTVDRKGGRAVDAAFEAGLRQFMERYRMAVHDLEVDGPRFVPLDIALTVCVLPGYFREDVRQALTEVFSNGYQPDGRRGFFHPDNYTFGRPVHLSTLVEAAMAVPGVSWVDFDDTPPKRNRFRRRGRASSQAVRDGWIRMGRLEIARLDNDPNAPENGRIEFFMEGGV